jgi:AraC-like DNA-binding protein
MSERSFLRRYREATGMTPARAVERLRVEAARRLLVETHLPASGLRRVAASARKRRCGEALRGCRASTHRTTGSVSAAEHAGRSG